MTVMRLGLLRHLREICQDLSRATPPQTPAPRRGPRLRTSSDARITTTKRITGNNMLILCEPL